MFIQKMPTIKEESDESEYDIWATSEEVDFVENVEKVRVKSSSCWDDFLHYWCSCFY